MFWKRRKESDFSAEISAHVELEIQRLRDEGMSQQEAEAAAHRQFGNLTQTQERFHESGRWMWLEHLWRDFIYALPKNKFLEKGGEVSRARRASITRKLIDCLRLPPGF